VEVISKPGISSAPDHPQSSAGFCNLLVYNDLRQSLLRSDAALKPTKPLLAFEAAGAASNAHWARAASSGELQNQGVLQLAQWLVGVFVEYVSVKELSERYGDTLAQIAGSGSLARNGLIKRAISDATSEIDSYLQGRFRLPLPFVPPVLVQIASDIAIYRLLVLRPDQTVDDARQRYEDAIMRLALIRKGELDLGLPLSATPAIVGQVQITSSKRLFSREALRDA
jgi:phage gp36-like protein